MFVVGPKIQEPKIVSHDPEDPMLPCEFCEGLVPMRKLLEHQVILLKVP